MQTIGAVASATKTFIDNGMSSTASVKAKNQTLPSEISDVVRLFFLYQDNIETRLVRIKKGNEMALEFLATINEQIVGLSELAEELEGGEEPRESFREASGPSGRLNYQIKPQKVQSQVKSQLNHGRSQTYNGSQMQQESHLASLLINRTAEDFRQSQIITNLVEMKESVVTEIQKSQAAVEFILNYLRGVGVKPSDASNPRSLPDYSAWLMNNLDVGDFLEETHKFFHGVSRQKTHTPGNSGSSGGFGVERNPSQSGTPKAIKSAAGSGQGLPSQGPLGSQEGTNIWLPQISKLKRECEQKSNEIHGLETENRDLRDQLSRLADKYNSLETMIERVSRERDELAQVVQGNQGKGSLLEKEVDQLRNDNLGLREGLGHQKAQIEHQVQETRQLKYQIESQESQLNDVRTDLQQSRNAYIVLEAAYKEILADYGDFRNKELLGESTKNQAETTLKEIGLILTALQEKNDWLESQNAALGKRNTYLEDRLNQLNQAIADMVRENGSLKKELALQEANKQKKGDTDGTDPEIQKYLKDEVYMIQDENLKLNEDVEMLRRRIESLTSENKHLYQQNNLLKSKMDGRPRSSSAPRRRESVGLVRTDTDRSFQYQRGSPNGSILDALKDPATGTEEPDLDLLSMIATQAIWLSKAIESGAL